MSSWIQEKRKVKRKSRTFDPDKEMNVGAYNAVLGAIILYGLIMNIVLCVTLQGRMLNVLNDKPLFFYITYFVCCAIGIMLSIFSDNAILSFIGYNLVVVPIGYIISISVHLLGGIGSPIVIQAFAITIVVTAIMVLLSIILPDLFDSLGAVLGISLLGLLVVEGIFLILRVDQIWTSWVGAGIFCLYIGFDFYRAQSNDRTLDNAVDSALDIYLDVINLFMRILSILAESNGSGKKR